MFALFEPQIRRIYTDFEEGHSQAFHRILVNRRNLRFSFEELDGLATVRVPVRLPRAIDGQPSAVEGASENRPSGEAGAIRRSYSFELAPTNWLKASLWGMAFC